MRILNENIYGQTTMAKILIIIFCASCNSSTKTWEQVTELYLVLNDKTMNASDFIEKMEVIMLETNDNCLLAHTSKIKYINGKIYIFDMLTNSLLIFNKDGSCDTILSKKGIGPGDYLQMLDFNVSDNEIQIMDYARAIKKYDFNLNFIKEERINSNSSRFIYKDDTVFLWNEAIGNEVDFYITSIDIKNHQTQRYILGKF